MSIVKEKRSRFYSEFWLISAVVGLGFVSSFPIGFYEFRLVDLILIFSFVYFVVLLSNNKIDKKRKTTIFLLIIYLIIREYFDFVNVSSSQNLRTLFGMSLTFLTPVIYLVVRESYFDGSKAMKLLILACIISLLSQIGILKWGESEASGLVDIGKYFNISGGHLGSLNFQERTITVWRALSVGITFAILFIHTKLWIKFVGIIGLFLQTAGGGGGRGGLVFLIVVPLILSLLYKGFGKSSIMKKLVLGSVIAAILMSVYLWAPFSSRDTLAKTNYTQTHFERATEIFAIFTEGWSGAVSKGGFNARTTSYSEYLSRTLSETNILLWGVGFSYGAAFQDVVNGQAHNVLLDTWALVGIFGLIFFIIFQIFILADFKKLMMITDIPNRDKLILLSFAIALLYFYQPLLFQASASDRSFMIVFYLTAGMIKPLTRWLNGEFTKANY
ncbi:MAG: hypothetical protein A2068_06420 [Ignavibacteria bacterium GWB2_35_6b]|nr:MAG: hypothetical protein A2068_06420 [Ignavibacteria bacterium GWB2_35_6b]